MDTGRTTKEPFGFVGFDETSLVPQMVLQQGGKVRISPFLVGARTILVIYIHILLHQEAIFIRRLKITAMRCFLEQVWQRRTYLGLQHFY